MSKRGGKPLEVIMFKVQWNNEKSSGFYGNGSGGFSTEEEAEIAFKALPVASIGRPERWIAEDSCTDLEIANALEFKRVIDQEATVATTATQMQYDYTDPMNPIELGEEEVEIPAREEESHIEFLLAADYTYEILDVTEEYELNKSIEDDAAQGELYESVCKKCLNVIRAHNVNAGLSSEDITTLKVDFSDLKLALDDGQPWSAKIALENITDEAHSVLKAKLLTVLSGVV